MVRLPIVALLFLFAVPSGAFGHSFAIYVSTPVTPPGPMVWVRWVALVLLTLSVLLAFRLLGSARWRTSIGIAIGTVFLWGWVFLTLGGIAASASTAPPPGLGPPGAVYWRWDSGELWELFVYWNVIGAGMLGLVVLLAGRIWEGTCSSTTVILAAIPVVVYALLLLPFLATGALAHGWAGGYVMGAGQDQLADLNYACFRYAEDHDGTFPVAKDVDELLKEVEPYLERKESRYGNPITVHPAAWVFEKEPRPFRWNASLSGQPAPTLPVYEDEKIPVTCPYGTGVFLDELGQEQQ